MLIVPELQKVFILVPRTGTGTLYRELQRVYPKAMLIYRHMEADGCPRGYDRWERVGFVRHPVMRLWSLYRFLRAFGGGAQVQGGSASLDAQRIRKQASCSFEDWLLNNVEPFTTPQSLNGDGSYWPVLSRINPTPENKISQYDYLRPDLGTTVLKFEDLVTHMAEWGLNPGIRKNSSNGEPLAALSDAAWGHVTNYCAWDLEQQCQIV